MPIMNLSVFRWLGVSYTPRPDDGRSFMQRADVQSDEDLEVAVAILDSQESERFFGVPMARRRIQPVWLRITNKGEHPYRLPLVSLDPNYYSPLEAAFVNHFATGKRLAGFGLLAWVFLPLILLLPFKYFGARKANRLMNAYFQKHGIGRSFIKPGSELAGFAFTPLDEGTKEVHVKLLGGDQVKEFFFSISVPGLAVDYGDNRFEELYRPEQIIACDEQELRKRLERQPRATTNKRDTNEGDPLNLVVVGDFATVLSAFGARWDEAETIDLKTCWKTFKAFFLGSGYRYLPVSPLYLGGRRQDFALQRARHTINERLHLRLWCTPIRFEGKPVWVGQVSRDIGVRYTLKTWNLTTHKIDPDVDEAREYVMGDLMEAGRVSRIGYVEGVGAIDPSTPRRNLTGDPYFTDGMRAVVMLSENQTNPTFLNWA